ncbi:MAG: HNH endonuclease [Marinobacter sp.]|uniref:HNH endonuclease n=1 Tax=Marinobacter sp. TaxID=50741 RepID=UPI001B72C058|nr:HNH endonuclease [Marinobacter sp.]MBQ0746515.1 HNH endonuclease [Marinobacter sp.]MBQ0815679.1 HNH endonuclease [Marinobacter sp.]
MSKTRIPVDVRRDLWILSAGRCQFRGCNNPINRNFLTDQRVTLGEFCHIIGDSDVGPRGDPERSALLAKDPSNLILCCVQCHKTIDDTQLEAEYGEVLLQGMKQEHELNIQRLYDARDVKESIPFIITGRIARTPTSISAQHARAAVLKKTGYSRFPCHQEQVINLNRIPYTEDRSEYWHAAKEQIDQGISGLLSRVDDREIHYLDIFGLAQIPLLAYVGYRLGDRVPGTVHQAQRHSEKVWDWPATPNIEPVDFSYLLPDIEEVTKLGLNISISGTVRDEDIDAVMPHVALAYFSASRPHNAVVDSELVQQAFIAKWREFLADVHRKYGRVQLHIFPALPNSLALELGRSVFPKVVPDVHVWDYVNGTFVRAVSWQ